MVKKSFRSKVPCPRSRGPRLQHHNVTLLLCWSHKASAEKKISSLLGYFPWPVAQNIQSMSESSSKYNYGNTNNRHFICWKTKQLGSSVNTWNYYSPLVSFCWWGLPINRNRSTSEVLLECAVWSAKRYGVVVFGTRIPDHNLKEEWVAGHFFKCSTDLFCRLYGGALKMFTDVTYMPL